MSKVQRLSRKRGIALLSVLFIMVLLIILIGALLTVVPEELREVAFSGYDNRALYAADAGIEAATEGLQIGSTSLNSGSLVAPDGSTATYSASVVATAARCGLPMDLLQSVGTSPTGDRRVVDAVVTQTTYSAYGLWVNGNPNGVYLVSGISHYDGPVYLGGSASAPQYVDYITGKTPIFDDQVTFAGAVDWFNNGSSTSEPAQSNTAAWAAIDAGGYPAVTVGGKTQPYTSSQQSVMLANAAYGTPGGTSYPAPTKGRTVYLNQQPAGGPGGTLASGIYVQGDAAISMSSSSVGASPSTMTWTFSPVANDSNSITDPVTVAVNYTTNTTTVTDQVTKATTTYSGVPAQTNGVNPNSGVVFVNGNVQDVSGTYNGSYTLAVPDDGTTDNSIYVSNNILAHDNPQTDPSSPDELGLYANDVYIDDKAPGIPYNLTIQAAVITGNAVEVKNNTNDGTFTTRDSVYNLPLYGTVTLYGALAENIYGATGTFSGSTQQTGWAKNFLYDPRFGTCSPPGTPLVPGTWHLVAWKDEGTP
jgi:Tfp pilus assembly protein PilX